MVNNNMSAVINTGRILVTGGAGFIGSNLSENLLKSGYRITCVDNFNGFYDRSIKERNISSIRNHPQFELCETDIRDKNELENVFKRVRPGLVIHLAGMPGVRPSIENPFLYFDVNVTGTLTILEMMKKFKVNNMIFASSSSVYGNNVKIPFSESDPVEMQISPYASSKRSCELLCYTYHSLYDFNISCLRFFTVYGPRQRPDLAIHKFTEKILAGEPIQIYGSGATARDYTFITDITDGIEKAIKHLNGFSIYNLGESQVVTLTEMIETIENALGTKAVKEYLPGQPGDVVKTFADISKARDEIGYNPVTTFKEGIELFIKWKINERAINSFQRDDARYIKKYQII